MADTISGDLLITSANATAILVVDELYPAGFQLQNFAADTAITATDLTIAEHRMGVDGHLAVGYIPSVLELTITLEANSPSREKLEYIVACSRLNLTAYECDLLIILPAIGKQFTYSTGFLSAATAMPALKKVLDPTTWNFVFENLTETSF